MSNELVTSTKEIIFNDSAMNHINQVAELMSSAVCTVPKHLQGQKGDCFAIALQAAQWGMNPFVVAQKTHLINGTLGYEAQLVNAVLQSSGAISGRFHYEYQGDGGSLVCRVGAIISGEREITWGEWLSIATVLIKNSPLWKSNPKQQIGYLQIKNWARAFCPGAIMGVYTNDELEEIPEEKIINPDFAVTKITKDELILKIKEMSISDFKTIDPRPYTNQERSEIRRAMEIRKEEINALVVNQDDPYALGATLSLISNATSIEELNAIDIRSLKADEQKKAKTAWLKKQDGLVKNAELMKKAKRLIDQYKEASWEDRIADCQNTKELTELLRIMPEAVQMDLADLIDNMFDSYL